MNKPVSRKNITDLISEYPAFYQKVWLACLKIPRGQTRSYKWIAEQIGRPKAFRAAANALAKNPFAPVIPCHRVIRSNGSIGGYSARGGQKAKRKLIMQEEKSNIKYQKSKIRQKTKN